MNTNEHDSDPRAELRRMLVAVLLGEAEPDERAEVERALSADPELARERERLEATIHLVAGLKGADASEHLSPAAAARLAEAASRRHAAQDGALPQDPFQSTPSVQEARERRAWTASPLFRMAAMIAVLVGAFAAWRASQPEPSRLDTASLDRKVVDKEVPTATTALRELRPGRGDETAELKDAELGDDAARVAGEPEAMTEADSSFEAGAESLLSANLRAPGSESGAEPTPLPALDQSIRAGLADGTGLADGAVRSATLSKDAGLGEKLGLLDELAVQERTRDSFVGVIRSKGAEAPGAVAPPGAAGGAGPASGPTAGGGPASPGPAGPATRGSAPVSVGRVALDAGEAATRLYYEHADQADKKAGDDFYLGQGQAKQEPAPDGAPQEADFDAEVAQAATLDTRLQQLGYTGKAIDAPGDAEALERLRGLGYVGAESGNDDRFEGSKASGGRVRDELLRRQRALTPEEREHLIDELLASCRRRPNERPRDMFFRWWGDNPFELARNDPLSTFSVDVDTASYTLARRYLAQGVLPEKAQIRTEEFVNYFKGDVPPPTEGTFRVATEMAPSLFSASPDTWMLRVAIRGREVSREERKPLALTFVVDVSGSMQEQNRLELVKHAMRLLVGELDARDAIAIVAFTNDARLILPMTSARNRGLIESAIYPLSPEGGTNVQAGLRMGYEAALAGLAPEANNRVVLLSDGVGNIGETDAAALDREAERQREHGIYLNTVGVGMNNHDDAFLEQLADHGDGICNYVDDEREARRALVENFTGAFEPIARDAKVQVEFDPAQVERYRLLGYENRAIADRDFRNDAVDAGEVGSGHQVVALYELVRTGRSDPEVPLATVRLRWKPPYREMVSNQLEDGPASEMAQPVLARDAAASYAATSPGYRKSVLVAQLAEFLRRSIHARDDSFETLLSEARKLAPELADPDFDEFVKMVERTVQLISAEWSRYDGVARRIDALRRQNYLRAQLEDLKADLDRARLDQIDRQIAELEGEVREQLERGTLVK